MGKKRNKKTNANRGRPALQGQSTKAGSGAVRNTALAILGLGAGIFAYALATTGPSKQDAGHAHDPAMSTSVPPSSGSQRRFRYFESAEAAQPLPETLSPGRFRDPIVAASYAVAKEIPEILAQQPCLCGCDNPSDDHRSLLDCHTDEHAATCMVCVKEAIYASQMTEAGKSPDWIRESILRHEFSTVNLGN